MNDVKNSIGVPIWSGNLKFDGPGGGYDEGQSGTGGKGALASFLIPACRARRAGPTAASFSSHVERKGFSLGCSFSTSKHHIPSSHLSMKLVGSDASDCNGNDGEKLTMVMLGP